MPNTHSMSAELTEGATDGRLQKVRPNTRVADFAGDAMIRENKRHLSAEPLSRVRDLTEFDHVAKVRPA